MELSALKTLLDTTPLSTGTLTEIRTLLETLPQEGPVGKEALVQILALMERDRNEKQETVKEFTNLADAIDTIVQGAKN
jgi:hypothetical protein